MGVAAAAAAAASRLGEFAQPTKLESLDSDLGITNLILCIFNQGVDMKTQKFVFSKT